MTMALIETKKLPGRLEHIEAYKRAREKREDLEKKVNAFRTKTFAELTKQERDILLQAVAERLGLVRPG